MGNGMFIHWALIGTPKHDFSQIFNLMPHKPSLPASLPHYLFFTTDCLLYGLISSFVSLGNVQFYRKLLFYRRVGYDISLYSRCISLLLKFTSGIQLWTGQLCIGTLPVSGPLDDLIGVQMCKCRLVAVG